MITATSNRFNLTPGLKPEEFRARELSVHRITLARARRAGVLGFLRIGDRVFYDVGHIEAWLERGEIKPKAGR